MHGGFFEKCFLEHLVHVKERNPQPLKISPVLSWRTGQVHLTPTTVPVHPLRMGSPEGAPDLGPPSVVALAERQSQEQGSVWFETTSQRSPDHQNPD